MGRVVITGVKRIVLPFRRYQYRVRFASTGLISMHDSVLSVYSNRFHLPVNFYCMRGEVKGVHRANIKRRYAASRASHTN